MSVSARTSQLLALPCDRDGDAAKENAQHTQLGNDGTSSTSICCLPHHLEDSTALRDIDGIGLDSANFCLVLK